MVVIAVFIIIRVNPVYIIKITIVTRWKRLKEYTSFFHLVEKVSIAFVLINTDLGEGASVEQSLKEIHEVKEVYGVYGVYDYVVRLEAETMQLLKDVITTKIRRINHVRSTLTMIVVD